MVKKDKQVIVEESLNASIDLLNDEHIALLIRSTGFGKTWIGSELAALKGERRKWKKVIFVVPLRSIEEGIEAKYKSKFGGVNYKYISYSTFALAYTTWQNSVGLNVEDIIPDLEGMEDGLFIFEECHRMGFTGEDMTGVNKSSKFIKLIRSRFPGAYYFGSTATPYRMDGADIMYTFFKGKMVFPYTIKDAIRDGFYRKPVYIEGDVDVRGLSEELEEKIFSSNTIDAKQKDDARRSLVSQLLAYSKVISMPNYLREGIDSTDCPKDYMRFILYFSNEMSLNANRLNFIEWFKEAFPGMEVNGYVKTSSVIETEDDGGTVLFDTELGKKKGTIDLIFSINQLVMGYHDKDITGVILYRLTASDIIYRQAVGRCYDMEIEHQTIIFDIAGNSDSAMSRLNKMGSTYTSKGGSSAADYLKYVGVFDDSVVEIRSRRKDIEKIRRMYDFDRQQLEKELVWNYHRDVDKEIFTDEFCASELRIDVASWKNVLEWYCDITGQEEHGDY